MSRPQKPLSLLAASTVKSQGGRIAARLAAPKPRGKLGRASRWLSVREKRIWCVAHRLNSVRVTVHCSR